MGPRPLGQTKVLRPGDFLFREGQPLRMVYVIAEGSLQATVRDPRDVKPEPVSEATFGIGSVFGWSYMLWQDSDPPLLAPFSTSVSANTLRCIVESYTREEFLDHLRLHPERVFAYIAEAPRVLTKLFDPARIADALSTTGEVSIPPPRPSQPGGTITLLQRTVGRLESQVQLIGHVVATSVLPMLEPHKGFAGVTHAIELLKKLTSGQIGTVRGSSQPAASEEPPPESPGRYRRVSGVRPAASEPNLPEELPDGDRPTPLEIPKAVGRKG